MKLELKKIAKNIVIRHIPKSISHYIQAIYYCRLVGNYPETQEPELAVIKKLIKPGDQVIDIGANIGCYTKFLSRLAGKEGKVFSIEPVPRTYQILDSNIKKLRLTNVVTANFACNDTDGYTEMEIPGSQSPGGENFYGARIPLARYPQSAWRRIEVQCKTLDRVFLNTSLPIAFIKCDVEGNETKVFKGAVNMLAKFKPILFIEIVKDPDDTNSIAYETFLFLRDHGYRPFYFDGFKLRPREKGIRKLNYFFLAEESTLNLEKPELFAGY